MRGMARCFAHDVAVLEGIVALLGGDDAGDVGHVHHEQRAVLVRNLAVARVVPVPRVRRAARDEQLRVEHGGLLCQLVHIDVARAAVERVRERLEVDGGGGDLLLGRVVTVGQVATRRQVEPHQPVVRRQHGGEHGEVGGAAGIRLHIDAPLLRVQAVHLQGALLDQALDLVDQLVAAIVARAGQAWPSETVRTAGSGDAGNGNALPTAPGVWGAGAPSEYLFVRQLPRHSITAVDVKFCGGGSAGDGQCPAPSPALQRGGR